MNHTWADIFAHPGYEIYRSNGKYLFEHNKFIKITSGVNNGNVYTKKYLSRIDIPESSFEEDYTMTFKFNAKIYNSTREQKTMIYRWGMNTYHISAMGNIRESDRRERTDRIVEHIAKERNTSVEEGVIMLRPHFEEEYYQQIP